MPPKPLNKKTRPDKRRPIQAVLYGPPGVGKTSMLAHIPGVGFFLDPTDDGIADLVDWGQTPEPRVVEVISSFNKLVKTCERIALGKYDIEAAVFDNLTGFELICFQYHCDKYFDNDWSSEGFYSWGKGPKNAAKVDWPRFLQATKDIREQQGIDVWLIGHSEIRTFQNQTVPDFDRHTPELDKKIWGMTHKESTTILFYTYEVDVETRKAKGSILFRKGKVDSSSERRVIYTVDGGNWLAKNRFGLNPCIDCGSNGQEAYEAWETALKVARKKKRRK